MNAMILYMKLRTVVACSLLATSLGSLAAAATSVTAEEDTPSRLVKFADLDLRRSEGAAALYARISSAAREVCSPEYNWVMEMRAKSAQCRSQAIANAVAGVDAPALTTYYTDHTRSAFAKR
jgi:UrcA family protein